MVDFHVFQEVVNVGYVALGERDGGGGGRWIGHYVFVECLRKLETISLILKGLGRGGEI